MNIVGSHQYRTGKVIFFNNVSVTGKYVLKNQMKYDEVNKSIISEQLSEEVRRMKSTNLFRASISVGYL